MKLTQEEMVKGVWNSLPPQVDVNRAHARETIRKQVAWAFEQLGNPDKADMYELDPYLKEYANSKRGSHGRPQ